jgi:hypothetical protein
MRNNVDAGVRGTRLFLLINICFIPCITGSGIFSQASGGFLIKHSIAVPHISLINWIIFESSRF